MLNQVYVSSQYASVIGCLMYTMVCTRPNIAHVVSVVSKYMVQPGRRHLVAVKWILLCLRGTTDVGHVYEGVDTVLNVTS